MFLSIVNIGKESYLISEPSDFLKLIYLEDIIYLLVISSYLTFFIFLFVLLSKHLKTKYPVFFLIIFLILGYISFQIFDYIQKNRSKKDKKRVPLNNSNGGNGYMISKINILNELCILLIFIFYLVIPYLFNPIKNRFKTLTSSLEETVCDLLILMEEYNMDEERREKLMYLMEKACEDKKALKCCKKIRYYLRYGSSKNFFRYLSKCYNEHNH